MVSIKFLGKWGLFRNLYEKFGTLGGKRGHILKVKFSKDKQQLMYI
jgi:hypothetical protein